MAIMVVDVQPVTGLKFMATATGLFSSAKVRSLE